MSVSKLEFQEGYYSATFTYSKTKFKIEIKNPTPENIGVFISTSREAIERD